MPRFSDEWLIDKVLFDVTFAGGCACCSFNFMPNGNAGIIQTMSEFETDAKNSEISALEKLPWPQEMKDQIWMERVRVRQFCKLNMKEYKRFWNENPEFSNWFLEQPEEKLRKWFQLPRQEVVERLKNQNYVFHQAFGTLLCGVMDQIAHFDITGYEVDGRGDPEIEFETCLKFDRRGGFTLADIGSDETKNRWLLRHKALGGPKLLERKERNSNEDEEEEGESEEEKKETTSKPSFRSDRRIVRLLIARHFADMLQRIYLKEQKAEQENEVEK